MKSVSNAMTFERTPLRSKKVTRKWAIKAETKHLEKLSSSRILWYLYKRHELGLAQLTVVIVFIVAILSNI